MTERVEGTPEASEVYADRENEFVGSKRVVFKWIEDEPLELLPCTSGTGIVDIGRGPAGNGGACFVYIFIASSFIDFNSSE